MIYQLVTAPHTVSLPVVHFPSPLAPINDSLETLDTTEAGAILKDRAPDGDTIGVDLKSTGKFDDKVKNTIRYLHMDTRETHFNHEGQGQTADQATDANLRAIGVTEAIWAPQRSKLSQVSPANLQVRVLYSGTDKYGRVLGMPIRRDVNIDPFISDAKPITAQNPHFKDLIESTVNHHLVKSGLAYATYYNGVHPVEIALFNSALIYAQGQNLGIWAKEQDQTLAGIYVRTLGDITGNKSLFHPVVFRRLVDFLKVGQTFSPAAFKKFLEANPDKLRKLKSKYTEKDIADLKDKSLADVLEDKEYLLQDLFEIEKAEDGKGYLVRLTEPLENFVRF